MSKGDEGVVVICPAPSGCILNHETEQEPMVAVAMETKIFSNLHIKKVFKVILLNISARNSHNIPYIFCI